MKKEPQQTAQWWSGGWVEWKWIKWRNQKQKSRGCQVAKISFLSWNVPRSSGHGSWELRTVQTLDSFNFWNFVFIQNNNAIQYLIDARQLEELEKNVCLCVLWLQAQQNRGVEPTRLQLPSATRLPSCFVNTTFACLSYGLHVSKL